MIGALFGLVFYVLGLVVGLVYGTVGLAFYVVFGLAGFVLSWLDIYFCWYAALLMLYWVEYIDPWETKQRRDEVITFFPTIARLVDGGASIAVTVHGWLYHPKRDTGLRRAIIAGLKRTMPAAADAAENLMVESRLSAFIVDNRRGKRVSVQFLSSSDHPGVHTLATLSGRNGHFQEEIVIPRKQASLISYQQPGSHFPDPRWVRFSSVLEDEQQTVFKGEALLLEDVGVSVISDIDDTIRISMVCDKRKLVLYSFLKRLRAVPGMAHLYRHWAAEFGARFHYVSGGPWQYYQSINEFFELSEFPKGTVHLRHLRIKDSSLFAFIKSPHFAKKRLIEPILKQFPKRKFILVGDSGEKDPEIYAELAAQFPDQVKAIFIRRAPEHKAVTVVSKTTTVKEIDDKASSAKNGEEVESGSEDDEMMKPNAEASMIAASCGEESTDDDDDEQEVTHHAVPHSRGRRGSIAYFRDAAVSNEGPNEMTLTKQETSIDIDGNRTRTETRLVVEVSEEDRECLAEMSDERKAREWKRFAPIFAPLKGHTLCRVFTCPSEISNFTLDDITHCRAQSGEDAIEWELVDPNEPPKLTTVIEEGEQKTEGEGESESQATNEATTAENQATNEVEEVVDEVVKQQHDETSEEDKEPEPEPEVSEEQVEADELVNDIQQEADGEGEQTSDEFKENVAEAMDKVEAEVNDTSADEGQAAEVEMEEVHVTEQEPEQADAPAEPETVGATHEPQHDDKVDDEPQHEEEDNVVEESEPQHDDEEGAETLEGDHVEVEAEPEPEQQRDEAVPEAESQQQHEDADVEVEAEPEPEQQQHEETAATEEAEMDAEAEPQQLESAVAEAEAETEAEQEEETEGEAVVEQDTDVVQQAPEDEAEQQQESQESDVKEESEEEEERTHQQLQEDDEGVPATATEEVEDVDAGWEKVDPSSDKEEEEVEHNSDVLEAQPRDGADAGDDGEGDH